jgi:hypothetical protein
MEEANVWLFCQTVTEAPIMIRRSGVRVFKAAKEKRNVTALNSVNARSLKCKEFKDVRSYFKISNNRFLFHKVLTNTQICNQTFLYLDGSAVQLDSYYLVKVKTVKLSL